MPFAGCCDCDCSCDCESTGICSYLAVAWLLSCWACIITLGSTASIERKLGQISLSILHNGASYCERRGVRLRRQQRLSVRWTNEQRRHDRPPTGEPVDLEQALTRCEHVCESARYGRMYTCLQCRNVPVLY